jgi:hypothetical protein
MLAGVGLLACAVGLAWAEPAPAPKTEAPPKAEAPAVRSVSGPYTHGNLTVFLLHGPDVLKNKKIVSLEDALAQKKAVVNETSNVNQLSVENKSDDLLVFVQSGDIVKGGKQDRAIAFDLLLPPKSGIVSVGCFCCEHGRWTGRGKEAANYFAESKAQIVGKDLKAAVVGNDASKQGEVWQKVNEAQMNLSRNVGKPVNAAASPSSLQLALEDKDLNDKVNGYEKDLADAIKGKDDVIGMALCINGKVEGAEMYGSAALFRQLWPKLLKSAATDALAQFDAKKKVEPPAATAVETFLAEAAAAPAKEVAMMANVRQVSEGRGGRATNNAPAQNEPPRQVVVQNDIPNQAGARAAGGSLQTEPMLPPQVRIVRYDGTKTLLVECQDRESPVVIHRCYFAKDEPKKEEPKKP